MNHQTLNIAERFHSIQGEGTHVGTSMHFIRTAGCNVGRLPVNTPEHHSDFPILKTGHAAFRCATYDGRGFWCDTDFHKGIHTMVDELIEETWEEHICLTGGEPLLHQDLPSFARLLELAFVRDLRVHIETSGTIGLRADHLARNPWICISPKKGCLPSMLRIADEIKLLVDDHFDARDVPQEILLHPNVFIQPVNQEMSVDPANLELCNEVLRKFPSWRLSVQLHKFLGVR